MHIANYGALKAELNEYLFHQRFVARYATATENFENAANRRLRVRQMEASTTLTTDVNGLAILPPDYLLWRSVLWIGTAGFTTGPIVVADAAFQADAFQNDAFQTQAETTISTTIGTTITRSPYVELDYVHPAYLRSTWVDLDHGNPKIFSIEGEQFQARPVGAQSNVYELHYYQKIPTIAVNNDSSNWLLEDYPDVYLFGVLTELGVLGRNQDMANLHKSRRDELFQEIIQLSALTTGATSPMVRTAEYF